jgi:hypothetical protein
LVTPRTVVNWHHAGFRLYWAWVSKVRKVGGRKRVGEEVRTLIWLPRIRPGCDLVKLLELIVGKEDRSDRPSHRTLPTRLERRGNRPFEALGQCTHTRKGGTRTARKRCICQHEAERG